VKQVPLSSTAAEEGEGAEGSEKKQGGGGFRNGEAADLVGIAGESKIKSPTVTGSVGVI